MRDGALTQVAGAGASELIYQPVNPSFGGNPFNSDHLLATEQVNGDNLSASIYQSGLFNMGQTSQTFRDSDSATVFQDGDSNSAHIRQEWTVRGNRRGRVCSTRQCGSRGRVS